MTDVKKLRELAEKATPGPWTGYNRGVFSMASPISNQGYGGNVCAVDMQKDFEFIKAANPQAIIEILDMVDRYEKTLKKVKPSVLIDHNCEECGTFTSVCYEIADLKEIREALEGGK